MKMIRILAFSAGFSLLCVSAIFGQDPPADPPQTPDEQHAFLHQFEGEWKVSGKGTDPSGKDMTTVGTEYDRMVLGDFWLFFVYNAQVNGKPFVGHGIIGYDPHRKKYIGTWVDSSSPMMLTFEGTGDPKSKTLTLESSGTDPSGAPLKGQLVYQFQDADHRTLQSFKEGEGGKMKQLFLLEYSREQPTPAKPAPSPK